MAISQSLTEITGQDETDCFILLRMQRCPAFFQISKDGGEDGEDCLACAVPAEDKGEYHASER